MRGTKGIPPSYLSPRPRLNIQNAAIVQNPRQHDRPSNNGITQRVGSRKSPTMTPSPPRIVDLDHRAFHLRGAPPRSRRVAAAPEGTLTLVDVDSGRMNSITGLPKIRDTDLHPMRDLLA